MSQKSEPVFIVQRRETDEDRFLAASWVNVRVADDREDARRYVSNLNRRSRRYQYRVDPHRSTKL